MAAKYDVEDCLCLSVRRSARLLTQRYDEALRPVGLRVTQFQLLAALGLMEPTAHQPLADRLGMDRTTLTRNLTVLERDGLVRLEAGTSDRRAHAITLTAVGRARLHEARVLWGRAHGAMVKTVEGDEALPEFQAALAIVRRLGELGQAE